MRYTHCSESVAASIVPIEMQEIQIYYVVPTVVLHHKYWWFDGARTTTDASRYVLLQQAGNLSAQANIKYPH